MSLKIVNNKWFECFESREQFPFGFCGAFGGQF